MLVRAIFAIFVLLALLGDARIFLFVINRVVFGSHRQERNPWGWLMYIVPPLLLVLTALFWPVAQWISFGRVDENIWNALGKAGATWLIIAAAVGGYWVLDRVRVHAFGEPPIAGVRSDASEVIRLRRAHMPFAFIRNLGAHNDVYDLEVTRHEIFIDDLAQSFDGYRIAFLTDLHVAPFMRRGFYREVIVQVQRFDPDAVLLGGDFVSWRRHIPLMAELLLKDLHARDGVFAVLGNHDYWSGAREIIEAMRTRGVEFITNRAVMVARGADTLSIVGIDEVYRGAPEIDRAFADLDPAQPPCVAVSHHPDIIDLLGARRIDLLLCGHTHGGQIRFPFFGAVVVPSRHETEFAAGFHRVRNVLMYVSRGIGAVPPLRILCRPEVATFILRCGHRTA